MNRPMGDLPVVGDGGADRYRPNKYSDQRLQVMVNRAV